jgi:hypothetical protein
MNRPAPVCYLFGNVLGCVATSIFAAYVVIFTYQQSTWPNLICSFVSVQMALYSFRARRRIADYRQWKREWEAMSGVGPRIEARKRRLRTRVLVLLGALTWYGSAVWLSEHARDTDNPEFGYVAALFIGLGVLGVWLLLRIIVRHALRVATRIRARIAHNKGPHVVRACLPVPKRSPRPGHIVSALPDYCLPLLQHHPEYTT